MKTSPLKVRDRAITPLYVPPTKAASTGAIAAKHPTTVLTAPGTRLAPRRNRASRERHECPPVGGELGRRRCGGGLFETAKVRVLAPFPSSAYTRLTYSFILQRGTGKGRGFSLMDGSTCGTLNIPNANERTIRIICFALFFMMEHKLYQQDGTFFFIRTSCPFYGASSPGLAFTWARHGRSFVKGREGEPNPLEVTEPLGPDLPGIHDRGRGWRCWAPWASYENNC